MKGTEKGGIDLERRYIAAVAPLADHMLDMKPYLDKIRFRPLADPKNWNSAVTNGIFVRFGNVELSHDELLSMAEQEYPTG